ncbi:MAG: ATP-binding protein [Candidatus Saccharimonadales bacterium]
MIGYPGSGKSHFARELANETGAKWLNNDRVRSSLFDDPMDPANLHNYPVIYDAMDDATRQALAAGHDVVYDANVNHRAERMKNAELAKVAGARAVTVWVQTPVEKAVERVGSRGATAEQFRLSEESVLKHIARLEEPAADEACIIIDGTASWEEQLATFRTQFEQLR